MCSFCRKAVCFRSHSAAGHPPRRAKDGFSLEGVKWCREHAACSLNLGFIPKGQMSKRDHWCPRARLRKSLKAWLAMPLPFTGKPPLHRRRLAQPTV